MMLSDSDIRRALREGEIHCSPPVRENDIRPTGIRLHLADTLLLPATEHPVVDLGSSEQPKFSTMQIGTDGVILLKGAFALGSSVEHISAAPDIVCHIDGRSTLARLGLMIHCSSNTFDNIHATPRSVTFELANLGAFDLRLRAGGAVGLLSFTRLTSPIKQHAQAQYDQQSGPTPPALGYRGAHEI